MDWVGLILNILAAVGAWAHISPHMGNGANNKWVDNVLRAGNILAGEYRNNKSHPAPKELK